MYNSPNYPHTSCWRFISPITGILKIFALGGLIYPLVVTSASILPSETTGRLQLALSSSSRGSDWSLFSNRSCCSLYLIVTISITLAGYLLWKACKSSGHTRMTKKEGPPAATKGKSLFQDLRPVTIVEEKQEGAVGNQGSCGTSDSHQKEEDCCVREGGRKKLARMGSSPSLHHLGNGTMPRRSGARHKRQISIPSSVMIPMPMTIDEAVAAETYSFGDNPDYFVAPENLNAVKGPNTGLLQTPGQGKSKSSPFRPKGGMNRLYRSTSFQHHPFRPVSPPQSTNFVSTSQFPLPTLRPQASQPASPSMSSFPTTPRQSVPPSPTTINPYSVVSDHMPVDDHISRGHDELEQAKCVRYWKQYPRDSAHHGHARTRSLPSRALPNPPNSFTNTVNESNGEHDSRSAQLEANSEELDDELVMIFEQGQSVVTGEKWKWRRKVTVFRSDVLEQLEKEGLVRC